MAGHDCNPNTWEVESGRGKFKPAWAHRARPCLTGSSQWGCWMDGSESRAVDWISGDQCCCCSVLESHFLTLRPVLKLSTLECVFHPQTFPAEWIADREWGNQGIGAEWQVVLGSFCPSVLETFCPSVAFCLCGSRLLGHAPWGPSSWCDSASWLGEQELWSLSGGVTLMVSYHLGPTSVLKAEPSFWDFWACGEKPASPQPVSLDANSAIRDVSSSLDNVFIRDRFCQLCQGMRRVDLLILL